MRIGQVSVSRRVLAVVAVLCSLFVLLPESRGMDFPREGIESIPNGVAVPFSGSWWLGFPEGEGMINGEPVAGCDAPVVLEPQSDDVLLYRSPTGADVTFQLLEFSGRTTWLPEWGESTIAVWVAQDEFFAYSVDLATGKARWDTPMVYRRCQP